MFVAEMKIYLNKCQKCQIVHYMIRLVNNRYQLIYYIVLSITTHIHILNYRIEREKQSKQKHTEKYYRGSIFVTAV